MDSGTNFDNPDAGCGAAPRSEDLRALAAECNYRVRELALRFGVSARQLQRSFRRSLQCSPRDWLREQRLQRAQQLLRSAPSVKHVAYVLGFRQESQFCRDFKARFGHCPSRELPRAALPKLLRSAQANAGQLERCG